MPEDPAPSGWTFPPAESGDGDLVAIGADLEPDTLLTAYRQGLFPMGIDHLPGGPVGWWSPEFRGVLPLDGLRLTRSLRRSVHRFEIRVDSAFEQVVTGCADPARSGGWIDPGMLAAYTELHRLGWAHSVESWREGRLAGGLYGVAIGGLFAGESMFTRERDASKVALVALLDLLHDEYVDQRLVDTQWQTPHLASLGVVEVTRAEYLRSLRAAMDVPLPAVWR